MSSGELVALVCCDLGAIVRGRSLFAEELGQHLETGVGWVPANHALTPLGPVADPNPFGSTGDLRLLPDRASRVRVEADAGGTPLDFLQCDILEIDGRAWECCPRRFLSTALSEVRQELGARVLASFEHEFQLQLDAPAALPFSLEGQRRVEPFVTDSMNALAAGGLEPERIFAEYAPHQFEIPLAPAEGVASADRAVAMREVVREIARRRDMRATFAPLPDPEQAGNGVHIHISLRDDDGRALLHDDARPGSLSELGERFAAGILRHARALSALCAPSPVSAARLQPHRWSAGALCLAERNREALLRIPPLVSLGGGDRARQMRLEYRGADATANPHMALGAILRAGLAGVREQLPAPPILDRDPAELNAEEADVFGVGAMPASLADSLQALAEDELVSSWLPPLLHEAYLSVKRVELQAAAEHDLQANCARYAAIY